MSKKPWNSADFATSYSRFRDLWFIWSIYNEGKQLLKVISLNFTYSLGNEWSKLSSDLDLSRWSIVNCKQSRTVFLPRLGNSEFFCRGILNKAGHVDSFFLSVIVVYLFFFVNIDYITGTTVLDFVSLCLR